MADRNGSNVRESFESFFNGWLVRQENFLDQPVQALTSQDGHEIDQRGSLVQEVLSHYEQYLEEKSKAAKDQVFLFYSPPCSVTELTPEQEETIERVKYETRREERELTEAMETVKKVIEILSPVQTVKFLAASAEFQLRSYRPMGSVLVSVALCRLVGLPGANSCLPKGLRLIEECM
ncbi:hypothetical protein QUC31_000609 [Theobroma cacao]